MFGAFLKVNDRCDVCGEELIHHRADDFPAYIVIFIVGHVLVPAALYTEMYFALSYWTHLAIWLPAALVLTLGLLQPVKGVIVALQWRLGMHGFEYANRARIECLPLAQISARRTSPGGLLQQPRDPRCGGVVPSTKPGAMAGPCAGFAISRANPSRSGAGSPPE
jgi:uncharacterized protein (DUF983 family)